MIRKKGTGMGKLAVVARIVLGMAALPGAASATVSVSPYAFAPPSGGTLINFDGALPSNFTLTGGIVQAGNANGAMAPLQTATVQETSKYLAVPSGSATLLSTNGFDRLSFYFGSLDDFNSFDLLGQGGTVIASYTGSQVAALPGYSHNNDRITFTQGASDPLIYGLKLSSSKAAFEVDNVVFGGAGAVPEPASWGLMITGFGFVGGALRRSRRPRAALA